MAITDLIPWKKNEADLSVRRGQGDEALLEMRDQMNRMFDQFFERPFGLSPFFGDNTLMGDFAPSMDVSESDKEIIIDAELPGMQPEDIDISLERDTLVIRGEKRAEREQKDEDKRYHRVERSYGSFYRTIPLSGEVEEGKIEATFKNGVLKVKLPKTKEAQKKSKRISVKSG
jgi:HSP20 family protein